MKYKTAFRLALRAIGVLIFGWHLGWFLQNLVSLIDAIAIVIGGGVFAWYGIVQVIGPVASMAFGL